VSANENPRLWGELTAAELGEAAQRGDVVVLPIGAVEQHGPHLPLDTDSFTAFTIATRAAERVPEFPVLVLPPVWWGLSPYWMVFPGTLTLRVETLTELLVDIAGSVAHHGFGSMAIVNGHGGNGGLIQAAAVKASRDGFRVAALSYWSLIPDELRRLSTRDAGGIGHAGELETSIQLYLQPECVALDAVSPEQCLDLTKRQEALGDAVYMPPDPRRESPHGVYGMSHAGTREKGEQVVEAASRALATLLQRFRADQS
jgi:creatinine amidohydrolase